MEKLIKMTVAVIGGTIASLLGGFDILLKALLTFVILDYTTGVIKAIHLKELSSSVGFIGIARKVMIFVLVAVAVQIDQTFGTDQLRNITITFYAVNEALSIIENSSKIGLPVPKKIIKVLEQLKSDDEE